LSAALGVDLVLPRKSNVNGKSNGKSNVNGSGQECPLYTGLYRIRM
jgi:hypothetical protein